MAEKTDLQPLRFVTLGMFIIDEFSFADDGGQLTGKTLAPQVGGGGTYAAIGARIWLPPREIGMIIDRGNNFPPHVQAKLQEYGAEMWMFRDQPNRATTRALNSYRGDHRNFEYLTPRVRITPNDLSGTKLEAPLTIHFICSPSRALEIVSEVQQVKSWFPTIIYEPIPDRCIPEELPSLTQVLPSISILSPNAEEALSLLSLPRPPTKAIIEQAAHQLLELGIGESGRGCVIIRSGALGAFVKTRERGGAWVDAFWKHKDTGKIVDVTGAGNSFLGGLAAGLSLTDGDVYEATFHASVSASFIIEQGGLPAFSPASSNADLEKWNGDVPLRRLNELRSRHI